MKALGAAWHIGNTEAFEKRTLPWVRNGYSFDLWLELLHPLRQH